MTRRNTSESDHHHQPPPSNIPQYDSVDGLDDSDGSIEHIEHVEREHVEHEHEEHEHDHEHMEHEHIHEMEVKSNRGSTVSTHPRVTIQQDDPYSDGEKHVTVIEIASKRGSSRRQKSVAPSIPLPEHPAQSSPPPKASKPQSRPNPEMAFDIGAENIAPVLSHKMDMDDRDPRDSVQHLNTTFFEVFTEPSEQYHSIACVWTLSFKVFEIVRIYSYKILTLIFGLLIAFIGGFLFALFAFLNIWIVRPFLLLARMAFSQLLMVWPMFLIYVVRPFFYSVGAVFSTARLHTSRGDQVAEIWEKHIHHV